MTEGETAGWWRVGSRKGLIDISLIASRRVLESCCSYRSECTSGKEIVSEPDIPLPTPTRTLPTDLSELPLAPMPVTPFAGILPLGPREGGLEKGEGSKSGEREGG